MNGELPSRIRLELVTPDRLVARESVEVLSIPGWGGYLGILPGHAALLSELMPGELSYNSEAGTKYLSVSGGFVEVLADRTTVLADACERAEEIDVGRAEQSKQRAEEAMKAAMASGNTAEAAEARAALDRAEARLAVAARARG